MSNIADQAAPNPAPFVIPRGAATARPPKCSGGRCGPADHFIPTTMEGVL
jgi:hypothetical protein